MCRANYLSKWFALSTLWFFHPSHQRKRTHTLRRQLKTILKRVQKSHYLGFLGVRQQIERACHIRGLPSMTLNCFLLGK
jgi:hypothetical protein